MDFSVVRCLFLICSYVVLAGVAKRESLPDIPGFLSNGDVTDPDECGSVSKRRVPRSPRRPKGSTAGTNSNFFANLSCSKPSLSCVGRGSCSEQLHATSNDFTCYCDSLCEVVQDCCYDYASTCNSTAGAKENSTKIKDDFNMACVDLGRKSYWMKNNCSKSWPNNEVSSSCIHPPPRLNSSTYMDFLPVLGADNITYRNRHCAECNYQNSFELWILNMSLSFQPVGLQSIEDFIDLSVELKGDDIVDVVVPKSGMPRRYCPKVISDCILMQMANDCTFGGIALVFNGGGIYKNKYCAFCNDQNEPQCESKFKSRMKLPDFYLLINFKHKSQSRGFSVNPLCPDKVYDHHLKDCVDPQDIVLPVQSPLDKYKIAVWFLWPYSTCNNITHFQKHLTDVKPSDISNANFQLIEKGLHMIKFDVQLTLNQSFELLENSTHVEPDSAGAYSILKFVKPFVRRFDIRLGSKTVKVIKTSSRRLGCVGLRVFKPSEYTKFGVDGKIYVHETSRNYTKGEYFEDQLSDGLIRVCEKELPNDCEGFYFEYSRSEFELERNLSLYHPRTEVLYEFGQYTLENDTVYICHQVLGDDGNVVRQYLTLVGLCLSPVCLIVVLVTYLTFSQLRTAPGKNIINLTIALLLFDIICVVSPQAVQIRPACIATAFALQYFMLVAHVSMSKIAYDTLRMFADPIAHQRAGSTGSKIFVVLWISPLVFVCLSFLLWHFNILDVQYTKQCWLSGQHVFTIVYIPLCVAIAFNIICFARSIIEMRKLEQNGQMLRAQKQEKNSLFIYIKLSTILGLGWASIYIAVLWPEFSYVFVALTAFQGVYIFLAFVCKKNVLTLYRSLVCEKRKGAPASARTVTNVL